MENGEYDFDGTQEQKPTHPVNTRAGSVKAQISDIENVKYKLENKDEEIKELRKLLRMKVSRIIFINKAIYSIWYRNTPARDRCPIGMDIYKNETVRYRYRYQ